MYGYAIGESPFHLIHLETYWDINKVRYSPLTAVLFRLLNPYGAGTVGCWALRRDLSETSSVARVRVYSIHISLQHGLHVARNSSSLLLCPVVWLGSPVCLLS